jgi:hypothetical protein
VTGYSRGVGLHRKEKRDFQSTALGKVRQRRKIALICALFEAYTGERAWKAIRDRLQKPCYLSRYFYCNCNCIVMVFIVCSMWPLLVDSFVCYALFERGGLFYVLCLIELPLPPDENPFTVKINTTTTNNNGGGSTPGSARTSGNRSGRVVLWRK